jgi:protein phosphatase
MTESSMFENIRHAEKSDIGLCRHNNEDHFLIVDRHDFRYDHRRGQLFVIADGLGGHAAGEVASRIACEETVSAYYGSGSPGGDGSGRDETPIGPLERSVWSAHRQIVRAAGERIDWHGMGTTLSALAMAVDKALIAHVGDSRIYRCRDGFCGLLTIDHAQTPFAMDRALPGDDPGLCGSHILTQALGGYGDLDEVFTRVEEVRAGDRFLLCTDGLHGYVSDDEIGRIMAESSVPGEACTELVRAAIDRGGLDNVTVIVVQV